MQTLDSKTWKVIEDHPDAVGRGGRGGPRAALRDAARAYAALDRRMDEARALRDWVARSARALGLTEEQAPADDRLDEAVRLGVTAEAWWEVGRGLDAAARCAADDGAGEAERWAATVAGALALDPLEADILALALRHGLDRRTEGLFDALSGPGGGVLACTSTPGCSRCCSGRRRARCGRGWRPRRGCERAGCSPWTTTARCGCCRA